MLLLVFFLRHGAGNHFYAALGITIAFAAVGRVARGVDTSGALAGGVIALILATENVKLFWVLLAVFLITLAATKVGGNRKKQLLVAEADHGRSAAQVMSNLYIGTLMLARPLQMTTEIAVLLLLAALAEVAADTSSSEIGTAYPGKTVLITTWKSVPAGENGGISVAGCKGGVDLETSGGSIHLGEVEGNTTAHTSGGSISLKKMNGKTALSTSGGGIEAADVRGSIDASTAGGSITANISGQPTGDCRLHTSGGSIHVALAEKVAVDVDAKTSGGRVVTEVPVTAVAQGEHKPNALRGKINGGGPALSLETSGGSIYLRKR